LAHTPHAKRKKVVFDAVISIEDGGIEDVYDLQTATYHNFIGNGVVLHNCVRTTHAEVNAIANAARMGVSTQGAVAYVTATPCYGCVKALKAAGVCAIIYRNHYSNAASTWPPKVESRMRNNGRGPYEVVIS
jgi:deoxycytidylate deaminase